MKPRVTVYIPCNRYGRFLTQAIESVLTQSLPAWELIVIDDGSKDKTAAIASSYSKRHAESIRVIRHASSKGLQACANAALRAARGEYVMRLDADDILDESALLVMVSYLDRHPEVALVYPNYIYIDEDGRPIGVENRKRVGKEVRLLDLPAHGACALARRRILKSLGGYDERYDRQDGYELWLKVVNRYPVANVSTPLFSYRQHSESLAQDQEKLSATRLSLKRDQVERHGGQVRPCTVAIVTAKNTYKKLPNIALKEVAGRPLIDYTLEVARQVSEFDAIVVTTDDPRVADHAKRIPKIVAMQRPNELSSERALESEVVSDAVNRVESELSMHPDIVVTLSIHAPLRRPEHIREAIHTLMLYNADSVISVYEDFELHYQHGEHGLRPLNPAMHRQVRPEREALYVSNGAVRAAWREVISKHDIFGRRVGHIVMPKADSLQIKTWDDVRMVSQRLAKRRGSAHEGRKVEEALVEHSEAA